MAVITHDARLAFDAATGAIAENVLGAVYLDTDTGLTTPLTVTIFGAGSTTTTISSDIRGVIPEFDLDQATNGLTGEEGVRLVWASGAHRTTLISTKRVHEVMVSLTGGSVDPSRLVSVSLSAVDAAANTTAIQAAVTAATAGGTVALPAGEWPVDAGILVEKPLRITSLGGRAQLTQETWGEPILDILETGAGSTVENLVLVCEQSKAAIAGTVRDGGAVTYAAAVWACADNLTVRHVEARGFTSGVRVTNWDDATQTSTGFTTDVLIEDLVTSGCDWGVVATGMERFTVRDVRGSYSLRAGSGDPAHLIYLSDAQANRDVTIAGCKAFDGLGGHAYQVKNISGLTLADVQARNCPGVLSVRAVTDADISGVTTVDDLGDSNGSVYVQGAGTEARIRIRDVSLNITTQTRAIRMDGTDCSLRDATVQVARSAQSDAYDVEVNGTRAQLDNVKVRNTGAEAWRAIGLNAGSGHTVRNPTALDTRVGVTVASGVTGCVIDYDPVQITRHTTSGSRTVSVASSMTTVARPARRTVAFTAPGTAIQVRADETTHALVTITGSAAFSVTLPVEPMTGHRLTFQFTNTSGGASGAISWNATFVLAAAFTGPGDGLTSFIEFIYNGTSWLEVSRS